MRHPLAGRTCRVTSAEGNRSGWQVGIEGIIVDGYACTRTTQDFVNRGSRSETSYVLVVEATKVPARMPGDFSGRLFEVQATGCVIDPPKAGPAFDFYGDPRPREVTLSSLGERLRRYFEVYDRPCESNGNWNHAEEFRQLDTELRAFVGLPPNPDYKRAGWPDPKPTAVTFCRWKCTCGKYGPWGSDDESSKGAAAHHASCDAKPHLVSLEAR